MADVVDDFGRVTRLKADFESLSESLRSAVNKAVEYAAGRAKDNTDDLKGEFEKLVEAMEELGDDVKESLKSTRDFVDEVKKAAESVEKIKASRASGGRDTLAEAQKEQTRILQMLLRSHQKAVSEKAAKFTSGGTVLSAPSTKRPALKEMGFRPRGADKIPAMVSPGEFVVSKKGARGNEGILDRINRGYMKGGRVKPEYLAGGTSGNWQGRRFNASMGSGGRAHIVVEGDWSAESERKLREDFAHLGDDISVEFSGKFDREFKKRVSTWAGSIATAFTGRGDPWQTMFEGAVKDVTEFRREMRNLAFQTEGITGNFREAQAEFAKIGTNIAGRTGVSVTAFQKAYMNNARKGFKDQKAGMKVLESGLKLSTLIGSESQATAGLFADWHRELGLGSVQMERMANNMQMVARNTGVTGDELVEVMKSSDQILKNLRNQGTLTTTAARNITQAMAEFKKQGFGEEGQKMLSAMSGYSAFQGADDGTKKILSIASQEGGVDYRELMFGDVVQDGEKMGQMGRGLEEFMAGIIGVDPKNFNLDLITEDQRRSLSIALEGMGTSLGAAESAINTFHKSAQGIGGQLSEFEKVTKSATATEKEKQEAEKKMNDMLLSSSMDMLGSVRQVSEKFGDKSMGELSELLKGDNKFAKEFAAGTKDMASMAPHLSDSLKRSFGLSGTAEQMASQIQSMDVGKQMELRGAAAAEQLDKMMAAAGKGDKDFSARMQKAMASGDIKMVKTIGEEMAAAQSELQVEDAAGVDPMEALEQTMTELNETIRNAFSPLTGAVLDLIGWIGLMGIQIGMMGGSLSSLFGGPTGLFSSGGLGKVLVEGPFGAFFKGFSREMSQTGDIFKAFTRGFSGQWKSFSHFVGPSVVQGLKTALGPAFVLLGGIKGVMEADSAKRTKTEGFILGALTGGAKTGSFLSPMLGVEKGSGADKALGIAGAAAYGAAAGLAFGGPAGAFVGAILGGVTEIVKIITEGTDILQDIFAPFQVIVDFVYNRLKNIWDIIAGVFTLDIGRVFKGVFNLILDSILIIPKLILSVFQSILIGLPKLIFRTLMLIWELPKMFMGAIKSMFESLVDNPWVGPIFKVFSDAFNMIYDGFMAIWQPIADIFSGLYTVFNDLGKALFGTGEGGGFLAGVMWVLQKAVYAVSYVISWLLVPLKLFAWALGFVMKIIGNTIAGIIYPFQYLYDVLVGHSIVPDLVFGIIEFFAMLPLKIFGFLIQIPIMLGKALLNIPAMIGRAFMAAGSVLGSFGEALIRSFKKIPKMFFRGMTAVFYDFPKWLMGGIMDGFWAVGNFLFLTLPKMLWDGFKKTVSDLKKAIWDTLWWPFKKLGEMLQAVFYDFPIWLGTKLMEGLQAIFYDLPMWLGKTIWDGMASIAAGIPGALYGALHSAASAIGLGWLVEKLGGGKPSATGSTKQGPGAAQAGAAGGGVGGFVTGVAAIGAAAVGLRRLPSMVSGFASSAFKYIGSFVPKDIGKHASSAFKFIKDQSHAIFQSKSIREAATKAFDMFRKITPSGVLKTAQGAFDLVKKIVPTSLTKAASGAFGLMRKAVSGRLSGAAGDLASKAALSQAAKAANPFASMGGSMGKQAAKTAAAQALKANPFASMGGSMGKQAVKTATGGLVPQGSSNYKLLEDTFKKFKDKGVFPKRATKLIEDTFKSTKAKGIIPKGASKLMADSFKSTKSFFSPMTKAFSRAMAGGEGLFGSLARGAKSQMASVLKGSSVAKFASDAFKRIGDVVPSNVSKYAMSAFSKIKGMSGSIMKMASGAFSRLGGKGIGGLLGRGAELAKGLFGRVAGVAGKVGGLGGLLGKAGGTAMGAMGKAGGMVAGTLGKAGGVMGSVAGKGLGAIAKRIPVLGALIDFGARKAAGEGTGKAAVGAGGGLAGAAAGAAIGTMILPGIGTAIGGVIGGLGGGWLADKLYDNIGPVFSTIGEGITSAASSVWEGIKGVGSTLWDGAKSLGSKVWEGTKGLASKLSDGAKWLKDNVGAAAFGPIGMAFEGIKGVASWFGSWFSGGGEKENKEAQLANMAMAKIEAQTVVLSTAVGQHAIPAGRPGDGTPTAGVEPVHLRDITGTILRDRAGSEGNRLQSDELTRMEEASNRQVSELEQIRQGIQELVSLMKPRGGTVGDSGELGPGVTRDPRRPMHAARFGKMKFGVPGGLANRSVVNTGEV